MSNKIRKIIMITWFFLLITVVAIFYFPKYAKHIPERNISQIDVWTQSIDGKEKQIVLPRELNEKSSNVEIFTELPEEFESAQTICFWTYYQTVKVYVDGSMIYQSDEEAKFGKATVSQWNYVEIPEGMNGHEIRICFEMPYDNYRFVLNKVLYGSVQDISEWIHHTYGINQIMEYILMMSGAMFILFAFVRRMETRYKLCYALFGVMAILFGIWMRYSMQGIPVYWINHSFSTLVSYLAFFLIPIPLTIYLRLRAHRIDLLVKICDIMLTLLCISVSVIFGLQAMGIRDIQENLAIGQVSLIVCVVWAMFVAMLYYVKMRNSISVLTVINSFLLLILVSVVWVNNYTNGYIEQADVIVHLCVVTIIGFECILYFRYVREKENIQKRIQEDNRNLQLQVLTGQIRPHFILNTLGAIRSLIRVDANRASDLLYDFSKYIRKNMEQKDYNKVIPFLEELEYIETYLNLESVRFDEKLHVKYDIKETGFWILPLTVQPFVENSVKHGLLEKKAGGTVQISTYKNKDKIVIEIKDDGVGFDTKKFWASFDERKSIGMKSAIFRLKNEMNAQCIIESNMNTENAGTCIKILLPEKGVCKNENNNRR